MSGFICDTFLSPAAQINQIYGVKSALNLEQAAIPSAENRPKDVVELLRKSFFFFLVCEKKNSKKK